LVVLVFLPFFAVFFAAIVILLNEVIYMTYMVIYVGGSTQKLTLSEGRPHAELIRRGNPQAAFAALTRSVAPG
jgi:hypothetical protein